MLTQHPLHRVGNASGNWCFKSFLTTGGGGISSRGSLPTTNNPVSNVDPCSVMDTSPSVVGTK